MLKTLKRASQSYRIAVYNYVTTPQWFYLEGPCTASCCDHRLKNKLFYLGLMVCYLNENTTSLNFKIMTVMFIKGHMEKPESRELFSLSLK